MHLKSRERVLLLIATIALAFVGSAMNVRVSWGEPSQSSPAKQAARGMTLVQAAVLGIVEGVTEYLPVSSTGHLLLAERVMGIGAPNPDSQRRGSRSKEAADAYAIIIQAGAILAVLGLYSRHVKQMALGLMGKNEAGLKMVMNIACAFLPAAVIGLLLGRIIKEYLFGPWPGSWEEWQSSGSRCAEISKPPSRSENLSMIFAGRRPW